MMSFFRNIFFLILFSFPCLFASDLSVTEQLIQDQFVIDSMERDRDEEKQEFCDYETSGDVVKSRRKMLYGSFRSSNGDYDNLLGSSNDFFNHMVASRLDVVNNRGNFNGQNNHDYLGDFNLNDFDFFDVNFCNNQHKNRSSKSVHAKFVPRNLTSLYKYDNFHDLTDLNKKRFRDCVKNFFGTANYKKEYRYRLKLLKKQRIMISSYASLAGRSVFSLSKEDKEVIKNKARRIVLRGFKMELLTRLLNEQLDNQKVLNVRNFFDVDVMSANFNLFGKNYTISKPLLSCINSAFSGFEYVKDKSSRDSGENSLRLFISDFLSYGEVNVVREIGYYNYVTYFLPNIFSLFNSRRKSYGLDISYFDQVKVDRYLLKFGGFFVRNKDHLRAGKTLDFSLFTSNDNYMPVNVHEKQEQYMSNEYVGYRGEDLNDLSIQTQLDIIKSRSLNGKKDNFSDSSFAGKICYFSGKPYYVDRKFNVKVCNFSDRKNYMKYAKLQKNFHSFNNRTFGKIASFFNYRSSTFNEISSMESNLAISSNLNHVDSSSANNGNDFDNTSEVERIGVFGKVIRVVDSAIGFGKKVFLFGKSFAKRTKKVVYDTQEFFSLASELWNIKVEQKNGAKVVLPMISSFLFFNILEVLISGGFYPYFFFKTFFVLCGGAAAGVGGASFFFWLFNNYFALHNKLAFILAIYFAYNLYYIYYRNITLNHIKSVSRQLDFEKSMKRMDKLKKGSKKNRSFSNR